LGSASFTGNGYIAASNTARSGTFDIVTAGTGAVSLGSLNAPLNLRGSTITLNGTTNVATLDATAPATGMEIGNNITGGNFGLLGNPSFTGNVYIATSNTARTGTFDIATAGTGTVSIGSLNATLALRGSTTTLSSPLTLGTAPIAISGSTGSSPYLGGVISATFLNPTFTGTNPTTATYGTLTLTPGVYILNASGLVASNVAVFQSFSGTLTDGTTIYATNTPFAVSGNLSGSSFTWAAHVTAIVAITTTKSINFIINLYLASGSVTNNATAFAYNAVRIG